VSYFVRWQPLHWAEYRAELVGTTFNIFVGLSAVVFDFGQGLPMEQLIPNHSIRLLMTGLIYSGSGSLI
jgi:aquaporin Z